MALMDAAHVNNSTEASCKGLLPFYEVTGLPAAMLTLHTTTVGMMSSHAYTMATKVRLDHPVFAVIFQEMIVLIVCSCMDSILLIVTFIVESELLMVAYMLVARIAMLLHPVTWTVVTVLRYHLLIRSNNVEGIDMVKLKRNSLLGVWLLFLPVLLASMATSFVPLISVGWPQISMDHLDNNVYQVMVFGGVIITNLPDVLSMTIYFFMWCHFKRSVNVFGDGSSEESQPYGGIYMGPEELEEGAQNESFPNSHSEELHRAKSAMKALRLHLKLSMADVALGFLTLFSCNFHVAMSVFYICQTVCFFWLPFFVIRASFKQFGS